MFPTTLTRKFVVSVVASVAVGAVVLARGQGAGTDQMGTLAALTNEVHLLRLAVEKSSQAQSQMQAMMVYSSAQQSRLVQVGARSDAAHAAVDAALREAQPLTAMIDRAQNVLNQPNLSADDRRRTEAEVAEIRRQLTLRDEDVAQARAKVVEADGLVQVEVAKWNDLMSRLDQATR